MAIEIEIFASPGCTKCGHAKDVLRRLVDEVGAGRIHWREVNVLEELDHAVEVGVLTTPAIAIDGVLVFAGLPRAAQLRGELQRRLGGAA
ncbi:thioredoxin family protein [Thioalkalivibrio thiocyanodenitrificans]|uniref:thioredoxin family protein n=1 Tax=Thioalkalivibrio thiocyanodenitrificans TaxID=243063 RepID=UPI00037B4FFB|nr:thioredoxin family protein [Thioalkalivibrio thiocyanodenitrificans]